jgi:flavin-dependent dehydrogenase
VVVVGAGPAGSSVAALLARAGIQVLLLEATALDQERTGEFLGAEARNLIDRLNLLPAGWERRHTAVHEFTGRWGSEREFTRDSIFDARGHALALDRLAFDRQLSDRAVALGAALRTGVRVRGAQRAGNEWTVRAAAGTEDVTIRAKFLAVCAGRSGARLAGIPATRRRLDRLICLGVRMAGCRGDLPPSIEAYSRGWTYSVGLGGRLVVNICTERAGHTHRDFRSAAVFLEELAQCPIAAARVLNSNATTAAEVSFFVADASSAFSRPAAGAGWCLAGDCAQSMDPLSSSGIANSIRHAELISDAMRKSRAIGDADLRAYGEWLDANYREYLAEHRHFYGLEQRWPEPFWRSRQQGLLRQDGATELSPELPPIRAAN